MGKKEQDKFRGEIENSINIQRYLNSQVIKKFKFRQDRFIHPLNQPKNKSGRRVEGNMLLWPTDQSVTWHNFFEAIKL